MHPLYGLMVSDSGTFTKDRIEKLQAEVDRIYPSVLLLARTSNDPKAPRYWTALLLGTEGNRRDGVAVLDGAGIAMWVRDANTSGFTGTFEPWGIAIEDKGHYCAQRLP